MRKVPSGVWHLLLRLINSLNKFEDAFFTSRLCFLMILSPFFLDKPNPVIAIRPCSTVIYYF